MRHDKYNKIDSEKERTIFVLRNCHDKQRISQYKISLNRLCKSALRMKRTRAVRDRARQ